MQIDCADGKKWIEKIQIDAAKTGGMVVANLLSLKKSDYPMTKHATEQFALSDL